MRNLEEAITLKEGLNNFDITKVSRINASYVSGKLCNAGISTPKASKLNLDRNCASLENSTVASPVFSNDDNSWENFSDGLNDNFFSHPRKNSEDGGSRTVLVQNLPHETTCDDLFKLFGMYGNIQKVKIFFNNPSTALVQFHESNQASLAKKFLNNCPLKNTILSVSFSKSSITTFNQENNEFYKDFTYHKGQRYRKVGSKNFRNIAQPSRVVHLSSLNPEKELSYYIELVSMYGTVVNSMVLFGDSQNLLVEMGSIGEAVDTLVRFHNMKIDGKYLKVSFSKYETIKCL